MSITSHYNQYLENQLNTATPGKLLIMSLDGAIRFLKTAEVKMREHILDEQSQNICKAQAILSDLMSVLDMKTDPKLAGALFSLYSYMFDRLTHANIREDESALEEVLGMLSQLRETWAEAELIVRSGGQPRVQEEAMAVA